MSAATLRDPEVSAALDALAGAELVVGFTRGPATAAVAAGAARALAAGPDAPSAVLVHVDPTGAEEARRAVAQAAGAQPVLHVAGSGLGPEEAVAGDGDDGVRTVLAAGARLGARAVVVLNPQLTGTGSRGVEHLARGVLKEGQDLVLPVYQRSRHEGTLTRTLVVPFMRALFGRRLAHPMAEEFACSGTAAARFLAEDIWDSALAREGLAFWLPARAIQSGLAVAQTWLGPRRLAPEVRPEPLGATVGRVAGALFALAERLEEAWVDVTGSLPVPTFGSPPAEPLPDDPVHPERLLAGFLQGLRDLPPFWERILAPETLADVLALEAWEPEDFRFPDRLWVRIVYDFLLGYRFRVAHRSHIAQSLAPLYLGYTAGLVVETRGALPAAVDERTERLACRFEEERAYLLDRWR